MRWLNGWRPNGAKISKNGNSQAREGGVERMMGIAPPRKAFYNHLGPSWPKACYTRI